MLVENKSRIVNYGEPKELSELKELLSTLSSHSYFEDDIWVLDKAVNKQSVAKFVKSLYYIQTPNQYVYLLKIFALMRLSKNRGVRTVRSNLEGINFFFRYLANEMNNLALKKVNKKNINNFQDYLTKHDRKGRSKETVWTAVSSFFKVMSEFDEVPNIVFGKNPFSVSKRNRSTKTRYIEETVLKQLDKVFRDEDLPLPYRTAYWVCRLIPSRITEVCSMKNDSIKPYINEKVVSIPHFKQNGGHNAPEMRQIALKEEGMGKYLLDLLRRQIEASNALQSIVALEENRDYIFTYHSYQYVPTQNKYVETKGLNRILIMTEPSFNKMLKTICNRYSIVDSNGKCPNITSHMFRHNGITDRLYEGFRLIDIMSMTNHKSSQMIVKSYVHVDEDKLREKTIKLLDEERPEVIFRGRVIDTSDQNKINQIMARPFAHKIGKLGICSDISNCPSEMFECLGCGNFVPNATELPYFEEQVTQWEEKLRKFKDHPFMKENAIYNLQLNQKIVDKIKHGKDA